MAPRLAIELLISIFQEANAQTLHTLLFVSTIFHSIAEPLHYHHVVLRPSKQRSVCPVASLVGSLRREGVRRCQYVQHFSIFVDNHWRFHDSLAFILRACPNLLSVHLEDDNSFRFEITRITSGLSPPLPLAALRVGQVPGSPLELDWSRSWLKGVHALSAPFAERAIVRYASLMPNITCWELRGDLQPLDKISRPETVAALRSTPIECLRFIRQSWACSEDFGHRLFAELPSLQCIELCTRDSSEDTCWRLYRGCGSRTHRVWWSCNPGDEWKSDWQRNITCRT